MLAFQDLVQAKKTQRDKDWPMLRRLLEAHYRMFADEPTPERVGFWLRELRTPALLREMVRNFPDAADRLVKERPLIAEARDGDPVIVERLLRDEEYAEREADRAYWRPLFQELERLKASRPRRKRRRNE